MRPLSSWSLSATRWAWDLAGYLSMPPLVRMAISRRVVGSMVGGEGGGGVVHTVSVWVQMRRGDDRRLVGCRMCRWYEVGSQQANVAVLAEREREGVCCGKGVSCSDETWNLAQADLPLWASSRRRLNLHATMQHENAKR